MQKIYDVDKWMFLGEGSEYVFPRGIARKVRVEVNAPGEAGLYLRVGEAEQPVFLALVKGRDTIEFYARRGVEFAILPEGSGVFFHSIDGADVSYINPAPVSFTKIVERKARNREAELIQWQAQANLRRMMEAQESELRAIIATRLEAERALAESARNASGGGGKPPSDAGAAPSDGSDGEAA